MSMLKRFIRLFMLASIVFVCIIQGAWGKAPMAKKQVPGYYRMQLGRFEVTALYDGQTKLNTHLLKNVKPGELNRLLARFFVGNPQMATAVNAYLINTGTHLVLVDTGTGAPSGSSLGKIAANIKASGYDLSQIDAILITHMHGDHIGGLNNPQLYPNAKIFVSKTENDYWLSRENEKKAPARQKRSFQTAQKLVPKYLSNGKWQTFTAGTEIVPGIQALDAKGHTPGHTAYVVSSDKQKLVIWGDVVHAYAVQFSQPGVSIDFDTAPEQAAVTRRELMKTIAADKVFAAGMHLPFPGIGHIRAESKENYVWVPVEFGPLPEPEKKYPGSTK